MGSRRIVEDTSTLRGRCTHNVAYADNNGVISKCKAAKTESECTWQQMCGGYKVYYPGAQAKYGYIYHPNKDIAGPAISEKVVKDYKECLEHCDNSSVCKSVVFAIISGVPKCWLKNKSRYSGGTLADKTWGPTEGTYEKISKHCPTWKIYDVKLRKKFSDAEKFAIEQGGVLPNKEQMDTIMTIKGGALFSDQ